MPQPAEPMHVGSALLEVEVLPTVGAKIGQVRDLRDGRLWLVQPQAPYKTLQHGTRWTEYDTSGMDDCFPSVDECAYRLPPWEGTSLPQLGEWVYGSWDVASHSNDAIALSRLGRALPYFAHKSVSVVSDVVRVSYCVENRGDAPLEYIWSAHPLLNAGSDFHLQLPSGDLSFVTYPPDGQVYRWPWYGDVDLSRNWIERGRTLKIFVLGLAQGRCDLRLDDKAVQFEFDLSPPILGIWFNHFGFPKEGRRPFRCIAIEPCTSPTDVLDDRHAHRLLEPGADHRWSMTIRFGS